MKRSLQEIIELVVFGLIALLVGMLLIWGAGWVFTGVGWLFRIIGSFLWTLLRFIIPVAIAAGIIYLVVRLIANQTKSKPVAETPAYTPQPAAPVPPMVGESTPTTATPPVTDGATEDIRVEDVAAREVLRADSPEPIDSFNESVVENADVAPAYETPADTEPDTVGGIDVDVDTSGYKEMDDLAEDLEEESDDEPDKR